MTARILARVVAVLLVGALEVCSRELPSAEMSRYVESAERVTARLPGSHDVDLVAIKSLVVDCSREIPNVMNTRNVEHLRLNEFTEWNDRLRALVAGLKNLRYCEVHGIADEVSEDWKVLVGLTALRYVRMELRNVDRLPPWFGDLKQLIGLDLAGNRISAFPKPLLALANLQELDLAENAIETITDDFRQLRSLLLLNLSHNSIRLIATEAPPELKRLKLRHNKLESFPENFVTGKALERLHLEYNYFTRVPSDGVARTRVTRLSLSSYADGGEALKARTDIDLTVFGDDDAI